MKKKSIYRVIFLNQGQVYELYASEVDASEMPGFVAVSDLLFGERSSVLIDPAEERLQSEFEGVHRFSVPMHAVIRIDEVEKRGISKIRPAGDDGTNIHAFPGSAKKPSTE